MKTQLSISGNKFYFISLILIFFSVITNAQIIYTDLIPDTVLINNGDVYHLDLNHDGIIDFNLNQTKSTVTGGSFCAGSRTKHGVTVTPVSTLLDAVANTSYSGVNYVTPIGADTIINDTGFIWLSNPSQNLANINWVCSGTKTHRLWHSTITGKWNAAIDKFLGLRFQVGSNTYFGWVRLSIGSTSFTVQDYAYNSVADQLIFSGQSTTEFLATSQISDSPFCAGDSLDIGYTAYGNFNLTNVFTAQLSDSSGSFTSPVVIGSILSNVTGSINASIPVGTTSGMLYRIRVVASNPIVSSNSSGSYLIVNSSLPSNHIIAYDTTGVCQGESFELYAPSESGNSYQWTLNNINISNETYHNYVGDSSGTYRCLISNGCGSVLSDSIVINKLPLPTAEITFSGPLVRCPGQSITFNANTSPGFTYTWYQDGDFISGATSQSYSASQFGYYYVGITDSNGCSNYSAEYMATFEYPYVEIYSNLGDSAIICAGDSVVITQGAATDTNFTYQWYRNGVIIQGAIGQTYTTWTTGTYRIRVLNPYGPCSYTSNYITVVTGCVGMETIISASHFSISPNPTSHFLQIESQSKKPVEVQIINHLGQIIYFEKINSSEKLIDVNNFSPGVYFIKWIEDDYSESKQFSVVK